VNALDRRHPSQRVYYRNVRIALIVAIAAHAAILAFAPVPLSPPRPLGPQVLRVVETSGALLAGIAGPAEPREAASPDAEPAPAASPRTAETIRASDEPVRMVPAEEAAPADAGAGTGTRTAGGLAGSGSQAQESGPPVFYAYDTAPRALRRVEPAYPATARAAGLEGTVVVNLNIDERGRILRAWVAEARAADILVEAALDAAYEFEFEPGTWRGAAVPCTVAIPFQFQLKQTLEVEGN
jgi:protein TonB